MSLVCPKLQSRAISEMGPLFKPSRESEKSDLGQGTRLAVGGSRLAGGSKLPGGRLAPLSPFLPLPPAPTSEELAARRRDEAVLTPKAKSESCRPRRPVGSDRNKAFNALKSAGMTRSYSTPVATQREYEEQCRAFAERQAMAATTAESARTFPWSSGWPTATPSYRVHCEQRRHASASAMVHSKTQQNGSLQSPHGKGQYKRAPLSPSALNILQLASEQATGGDVGHLSADAQPEKAAGYHDQDDHYFAPRKFSDRNDNSSESCSEGPATPKAVTPGHVATYAAFSQQLERRIGAQCEKVSQAIEAEHLDELIHPDHLRPPPLHFAYSSH